ncbi:MAG: RNA polymerase sigma factor [Opitutaceae bacterium]|jgi:RNA polymerase sigma-70 factor (ECF subfamily)|nr:RNA polymerase sigma factor [Opitutaceae bacterium]
MIFSQSTRLLGEANARAMPPGGVFCHCPQVRLPFAGKRKTLVTYFQPSASGNDVVLTIAINSLLENEATVPSGATFRPAQRQAPGGDCEARPADDSGTDALAGLVRQAQAGNEAAQHKLIVSYQHRVAGFVYTIINRSDSIEDLAQIIFIKMLRALPKLAQPAQFESWLFRMARNACIDHIRRQRWQRFFTPIETEERVLDIPDTPRTVDAEELDALRHALSKLKPKDRALLALAQEGRSQVEMAGMTGVSVVALKARLHRAREQLRQHYYHEN